MGHMQIFGCFSSNKMEFYGFCAEKLRHRRALRGYVRRERRGRGLIGTKETSSGLKGEGDKGERLMDIGEGDSALTHGALNKDGSAVGCSARETSWTEASWAADLRSR